LQLFPNIQVKEKQDGAADQDPNIEHQICAATDPNQVGEVCRVIWHPNDVGAEQSSTDYRAPDQRDLRELRERNEHHGQQHQCEDDLRDHRCNAPVRSSSTIFTELLSL